MDVTPNFKQPRKKKSTFSADLAWAKAIRERDGFRCQFPGCRIYDKSIHAHHKASRKQRPDLRHDIDNGVSLCSKHHLWVHSNPIEATKMGFINHERYELARRQNEGTS